MVRKTIIDNDKNEIKTASDIPSVTAQHEGFLIQDSNSNLSPLDLKSVQDLKLIKLEKQSRLDEITSRIRAELREVKVISSSLAKKKFISLNLGPPSINKLKLTLRKTHASRMIKIAMNTIIADPNSTKIATLFPNTILDISKVSNRTGKSIQYIGITILSSKLPPKLILSRLNNNKKYFRWKIQELCNFGIAPEIAFRLIPLDLLE